MREAAGRLKPMIETEVKQKALMQLPDRHLFNYICVTFE